MNLEFQKIDYYTKYYNKGYRKFIDRNCVICDSHMKIPKQFDSAITTCCSYCNKVKNSLSRSNGIYLLCRVCNKPIYNGPTKRKRICSRKCADLATSIFAHERNLGRIENKPKNYGSNWGLQRRLARERDNFTCQKCGVTEKQLKHQLSVHHIKPFVLHDNYIIANQLQNLISVCEPCHRKIHSGELHHSKYAKLIR